VNKKNNIAQSHLSIAFNGDMIEWVARNKSNSLRGIFYKKTPTAPTYKEY